MSDNVEMLDTLTSLDIPPERILTQAIKGIADGQVVIVGQTQDGEFYFASSISDLPVVLWLLEWAKKELLADAYLTTKDRK